MENGESGSLCSESVAAQLFRPRAFCGCVDFFFFSKISRRRHGFVGMRFALSARERGEESKALQELSGCFGMGMRRTPKSELPTVGSASSRGRSFRQTSVLRLSQVETRA